LQGEQFHAAAHALRAGDNMFVRLADAFDIHPPPAYEPEGPPPAAARPDGE